MIYANWSYKTYVKTAKFILILHNMSKLQQVFFWTLYTVIPLRQQCTQMQMTENTDTFFFLLRSLGHEDALSC